MSADAELEAQICGAVMVADLNPALGTHAGSLMARSGIVEGDLRTPRARLVWSLLCRIAAKGRAASVMNVISFALPGRLLNQADAVWLNEWADRALMLDEGTFLELCTAQRRRVRADHLATQLTEVAQALRSNAPDVALLVQQVTESAHAALTSLTDDTSTGDLDLAEIADSWSRVESGEEKSDLVTTGFPQLDQMIGGYYSNLNVIYGRTSEGKSALVASSILYQCMAGIPVGIIGLEDGTRWVARRLLALFMRWPLKEIGRRHRDHAAQTNFADACESVAKHLRNLRTAARTGLATSKLLQICAQWKAGGVRCIYIDHGGELVHDSGKVDEHRLRVGQSVKRIRDFAVANGIPVVLVMHARRGDDNDFDPRPPRAEEVRDSSDIENAARLMLGVWRVPGEDFARITIGKVTEGKKLQTLKAPLAADGVLLANDGCEIVDLAAERLAVAKAKKAERDAERAEARTLTEKKKADAAAAKANARAKKQPALFNSERDT